MLYTCSLCKMVALKRRDDTDELYLEIQLLIYIRNGFDMLFILRLRETTKNTHKSRGITMELDVRKYQLNSRK